MIKWLAVSNAAFGLWYVAAVLAGLWPAFAAVAVVAVSAAIGRHLAHRSGTAATVIALPFRLPESSDAEAVAA